MPWGFRSEPGSRPARSGVFHRPPTSCPQDWFASATIVGVTVRQCWVATLLGKRNEPSKTGRTGDQRLSSVARPLVTASGTLCVVLPCHRVVASSGALTAYSGGLAAKVYLLALESCP